MAWIYQLVDAIPAPEALPSLKVGAASMLEATQVHLSAVVKADVTVRVTGLVLESVRVVMILAAVLFPHHKDFCGQPTNASSCLLLMPLPTICWALSSEATRTDEALALVSFL